LNETIKSQNEKIIQLQEENKQLKIDNKNLMKNLENWIYLLDLKSKTPKINNNKDIYNSK